MYTHAGHSYDATSPAEIERIAEVERDVTCAFADRLRLLPYLPASLPPTFLSFYLHRCAFADRLRAAGHAVDTVGVGSTPSYR